MEVALLRERLLALRTRLAGSAPDVLDEIDALVLDMPTDAASTSNVLGATLAASGGLFIELDADGVYLDVAGDEALLATPWDELAGRSLAEALPPDDAARWLARCARVAATGIVEHVDYSLPVRGPVRRFKGDVVCLARGARRTIGVIVRDVTDTHEAEIERRWWTSVVNAATQAILGSDEDGVINFWNDAARDLFGWTSAEVIGRRVHDFFVPDELRHEHGAIATRLRAGEAVVAFDTKRVHKDGRRVDVSLSIFPIRVDGVTTGIVGVAADTTERHRAAEALRRSEDRFRSVIESAPEPIYISIDGVIIYVNPAMLEFLGYDRSDEVVGRSALAFVVPEGRAYAIERIAASLRGEKAVPALHRLVRRDGSIVDAEFVGAGIDLDGKRANLAIARDVTARRRAEASAQEMLSTLRSFFDASPFQMTVLERADDDLRYVSVNAAMCEWFGLAPEAMIGRTLREIGLDDAARAFWLQHFDEVIRAGHPHQVGFRRTRDGARHAFQATFNAIAGPTARVSLVIEDVSDREQMKSQLVVAERMSSLGTLAAGVAHEINNPLAYVMANVDFALGEIDMLPPGIGSSVDELRQALTEARQGAERVRHIVRDLKAFSRPDETSIASADVRHVLDSALNMVNNEIRHRATLMKEYEAVPPVECNEARLGQVFLNLLTNAAQAIPPGASAQNVIRVVARSDEEGHAVVEIHDTGCGIAPEVLPRIFDPFFTTKPVGVGTGLGLSIVHGIVDAIGGKISVTSEVGRGSIFRLVLPAGAVRRAPTPARGMSALVATARILVIDDEPLVGLAVQRSLARHSVEVTTSAREALERLTRGERFDVILCDLMMPDMTGMDLHGALARECPDCAARMVFLTGGAFTSQAMDFLAAVPNARFEKPFDPQALRAFIGKLVEGARA